MSLRFTRATDGEKDQLLTAAQHLPLTSPPLLTLEHGPVGTMPRGFAHDLSRTEVGRGAAAFAAARQAFRRWEQFDLGWVRIINGNPRIAPGELVAVEAHTAYLWSVNINRITDVIDDHHRFGFLYTTTTVHVEQGQERFLLERNAETESVSYLIEAISRPTDPLARLAYPLSRLMQHRFTRDSQARLRRLVLERTASP